MGSDRKTRNARTRQFKGLAGLQLWQVAIAAKEQVAADGPTSRIV